MNTTQLRKLGIPEECITVAIRGIQAAISQGDFRGKDVKEQIRKVLAEPAQYLQDPWFGGLAASVQEAGDQTRPEPIPYRTWGTDIDAASHEQMRQACSLPMARGAALMPDAHLGYGLPIGGVLALENAVVPYAVGVDIACRMKLSVIDLPPETLDKNFDRYRAALESGTRFGVGAVHEKPHDHAVLDADWTVTRVTREHRDKARRQLGTSGSGNHFVEFGVLTLTEAAPDLQLEAGKYTAMLSHSGSRGPGAAVCNTYSSIAQLKLPPKYRDLGRLGWLELDSEAGQEYWAAMSLMGQFAAANHDVIHRLVTHLLGARVIAGVENHHNFAWKEVHLSLIHI